MDYSYIQDEFDTIIGKVHKVSTTLNHKDIIGAIKVRWAINRNNYKVEPGIYAVGNPDSSSEVFVTANYKLSFDHLRKNLNGIDGWILVLDTKGINVWCAAGKGTFGTDELINRIKVAELDKIVHHKRIILPQLGGVGVAAHTVKKVTGFHVFYGPVRASDIKEFLNAKYRKTKEMKTVTFRFSERARLIPVDLFYGGYYLLGALGIIFIISVLLKKDLSQTDSIFYGVNALFNVLIGYISGIVLTPLFLPYLPFRSFALKGVFSGLIVSTILFFLKLLGDNLIENISWFLIITGVSSFLAMNFTGSSTYTSLSGVKKEMKISIPFQISVSAIGLILFVISLIFI